MSYSVKEIFYTLQGEGAQTGRPAVFCRFSGCNLWSGREIDRQTAICQFCDTDFVGSNGPNGGKFSDAQTLAATIDALWPQTDPPSKYVVFTGGEPLLQLDPPLIAAMHALNFMVAIETNGTLAVPENIDWVCVSPKFGSTLRVHQGQELKVVIPQNTAVEALLAEYASLDFAHFYLQAMDGPKLAENLQRAILLCKKNPRWKLSLQTHKLLGLP